jgi:hypothetical protein
MSDNEGAYPQLSLNRCCDCAAMSLQRLSLSPSDFNIFLSRNCVASKSECRIREVARCSHALTSKLFDDEADCSLISSESKPSLCNSDCESVLSVHSTMAGAKSLAEGDVAASVLGLVRNANKQFDLYLTLDRY